MIAYLEGLVSVSSLMPFRCRPRLTDGQGLKNGIDGMIAMSKYIPSVSYGCGCRCGGPRAVAQGSRRMVNGSWHTED